ncbi:MAG: tetratricopeptide repeat protein, partial [Acidobacteriota bacterium]
VDPEADRPRRRITAASVVVGAVLAVVAVVAGVDSILGPAADDRGTRSDAAWDAYQSGLRASEGVREDALDHLRRAIELDPGFAAAHAELADFYDRQGATDLASATIDRAIELAEDRSEVERVRMLRLRARIHEDLQAEEMWLRRLAVLDDDPEVRFDLAWFLFTHFRYCDEALVGIRGVLEVDPRPHFLLYLGEVAMSCGLADEALDALARAVAARPDEAALHGFRSYLQRLAGDVEAAERSAERALELAPDDPWIAHRQALVLHRRYRFDEALSAFRRARGLQRGARGSAASAWAGEAIVHLDRARFTDTASRALDEADEAADRILALVDPPSPEALAIRGLVDVARGDLVAARERLDTLDRHFESTTSRYDRHYRDQLRGRILGAEGRWRDAATAHADAVRNRPLEAADHRLALARAQLGAGEIEEAVGGLYRLFDLDPNHAEGRCLAAEAHERAGRPRAAASEWDACARLADALAVDGLFTALESLARTAPAP